MKNNNLFKLIVIGNTKLWLFFTAVVPNILIILISFTQRDPEQLLNFTFIEPSSFNGTRP